MKKQSDLSRLMGYAGNYRYFTYASWVLFAVSALVALVPFGRNRQIDSGASAHPVPGGHYQCGNVAGRFQKAQVRESGYGGIP